MTYRIKNAFEAWGTLACKAGPTGSLGVFDPVNLTTTRTYTLPDKDGTVAMLSDVVGGGGVTLDTAQTITGLKSFQQGDNASLGAECIVAAADRDFSAAGAWTGTGWSIVSNALAHTAGANAATLPNTSLNITPTSGTIYLITMKVITTTLGTLSLSFGGASMGILAGQWVGTVYINKYIAATGSGALTVTPDATWVGSIDDVSIKIITRSLIPSLRLYTTTATTAAEIRAYNNVNMGIGVASHRMNTSGSGNYAYGYYAQAGLTTGVANIAIGTEAQEFLSSGTHNIGIGYFAQNSITSSGSNIAIGGYVQRYLTTGFNNVAMGYQAQQALTVGWNNVAVGTAAQMAITTGRGNVAIGYQSEGTLTTGDYNMGIGQNCLRYLLSGSNNTAIGNNALYTLSTNGNNTSIGTDSLFNATSSNNTGVGYAVLGDLTTGGYNTAYGALAGDGATNATITYCSFFGYNARSTTDGITNSTAIGNGAVVTASNQIQLGNTSVTSVVTSGSLTAASGTFSGAISATTGTFSGGSITLQGATYPAIAFYASGTADTRLLFRSGNVLLWRYDGTNDASVWTSATFAPSSKANTDQTMYIGTTAVAINRASAALNLNLGGTFAAGVSTLTDSSAVITTPIMATNNYGTSANQVEAGIGFGRGAGTLFAGVYGCQQDASNYNYGSLKFKTKTSDALGLETKLTIHASGNAIFNGAASIFLNRSTIATQNYISFGTGTTHDMRVGRAGNSDDLSIWAWNGATQTEVARITTAGYVGIGVNPSYKLHVVGQVGIGQNTNGTAIIDSYGAKAYFGCNSATNGIAVSDTGAVTTTGAITSTQFNGSGAGLTGTAASLTSGYANKLNWLGSGYAATDPGTTRGPSGVNHYGAYNNGYPTTYGNLLHIVGNGGSQLLLGWSGSDGAHAENYVRSKRDNDTGAWSPWAKFITDVNIGNTGIGIGGTTGTFSGNLETTTAGNGLILKDASNGLRYRLYVSSGTLMLVQI